MKIRILMICPPGFAPVRHYRGEGVLERLSKIDREIEVIYPQSQEPWLDVIKADLVYFMRTITEMDMRVAETAVRMGVPLWYDADDDYFNVSEDSPAHDGYNNEKVRERITWFIENADAMTVSTKDLAEKYARLRPLAARPLEIIPNAVDDYALDLQTYPGSDFNEVVTWRGGATHQADLWDFAEEFWRFLEKAPEKWEILFMGFNPKFIRDGFAWRPKRFSGRVKSVKYILNYFAYLEAFRTQVRPWAHVVPLSDNPFNRSKSNIAALEAVYAGAIPIVPDWEEWQFPAALKYSSLADFSKLMEKATRINPRSRREMWEENSRWVRENLSLSKINAKRVKTVFELVGVSAPVSV